jgi:3',5'-cyclic AMP phosphodiesterase CpdA
MFRLAHVSDPHFQDFRIANFRELLGKRALGGLNLFLRRRHKHRMDLLAAMQVDLQRRNLDHLAITGDLCNIALTSEWKAGLKWIAGCGLWPEQITVIPGNHDAYVQGVVRDKTFERLFAPYQTAELRQGEEVYPFVRIRGNIALVCVSTAVPTGDMGAWGEIGEAQLGRLRDQLFSPELRDRLRILMIHHPPLVHRPGEHRNLRDRANLQSLLSLTGVDLVLHGHDHRDYLVELPGPSGKAIPVLGVGSASYDGGEDRRSRYHIVEIEGRRMTVATYVHQQDSGEYREVMRRGI